MNPLCGIEVEYYKRYSAAVDRQTINAAEQTRLGKYNHLSHHALALVYCYL